VVKIRVIATIHSAKIYMRMWVFAWTVAMFQTQIVYVEAKLIWFVLKNNIVGHRKKMQEKI